MIENVQYRPYQSYWYYLELPKIAIVSTQNHGYGYDIHVHVFHKPELL